MSSGCLTLVATPIGNLGDISQRAIDVLTEADIVGCEDSRRTGLLFQRLGVPGGRFVVVNEHTEDERSERLVDAMLGGSHVALVSDAGMPAISDPGARLVAAAHDAGIRVTVVPGASAALGALVVSGQPTARFVMEGFVPRRGSDRSNRLAAIAADDRTTVLYESPNRLVATLVELGALSSPDRSVTVVRELTKLHEEVVRGTFAELSRHFGGDAGDATVKGEVVIVVGPAAPPEVVDDGVLLSAIATARANGATKRDAVDEVAAAFGVNRNRVYDLAIRPGSG